ncbi:hypothetical protein TRICI_004734 [Trichomonascus ciferrii]|uniref:Uncharacterized protein n=1 Tax=Trichomonascus ciferrii TaxID=44093 RepID=A0A642V075_9ASCO|nr:hypothetical protein TRICI_004734 [Trichomonascus ciferrii]
MSHSTDLADAATGELTMHRKVDRYYSSFSGRVMKRKILIEREDNQEPDFFKVASTTALTPIRVNANTYKVLSSTPLLQDPDVHPCYIMVYHGILSHTYSLVPDQNELGQDERDLFLRPLATYSTPTKTLSHASITDMTLPVLPDGTAQGRKLRVAFRFGRSTQFNQAEVVCRINDDQYYKWKRYEFPRNSGNYVYMMHLKSRQKSGGVPVAVMKKATFRSPVDNSELSTIEIDATKVHPVIAYLTFFAGSFTSTGSYLASTTLGKDSCVPRHFPVAFGDEENNEDDDDEDHQQSNSAIEKQSEIHLRRELETTAATTSNEPFTTQMDARSGIITAPAALELGKPVSIKPIYTHTLEQYDMSSQLISSLHEISKRNVIALKIKYGLLPPRNANFQIPGYVMHS